MPEAPIPERARGGRASRLTTLLLFAAGALTFASCATEKPKTALISDPDAQRESSIPWNKPQSWEGRANLPGSMGGDPTMGPGY